MSTDVVFVAVLGFLAGYSLYGVYEWLRDRNSPPSEFSPAHLSKGERVVSRRTVADGELYGYDDPPKERGTR
jgi:hypothetical protein